MICFSCHQIFGCICFIHNIDPHKIKLDSHARKCIFLGYYWTQKGYRCYLPSPDHFLIPVDFTFFSSKSEFDSEPSSLESENDNMFFF